jgi:hypothetical protein
MGLALGLHKGINHHAHFLVGHPMRKPYRTPRQNFANPVPFTLITAWRQNTAKKRPEDLYIAGRQAKIPQTPR